MCSKEDICDSHLTNRKFIYPTKAQSVWDSYSSFSNLLFLVWLLDIQKSATRSPHRRSISSLKWRSSGWVGCKVSCRGNYLQAKMDQIACPMRSDSRMCSREFTDRLIHQSFLLGLIPQPVRAKNPQLYLQTTLPSTLKK